MRGLIASITTFALAMHITFGCCVHLHAVMDCCHDHACVSEQAACCGMECDQGLDGCREQQAGGSCCSDSPVACHDCQDCSCVATVDVDNVFEGPSPGEDAGVLIESPSTTFASAVWRRGPGDPGQAIALQRSPLFERLLV